MAKPEDIIALRDAGLRARILDLVQKSNGRITIADVIRAALHEKLERVDQTGQFTIPLSMMAPPALAEDAQPSAKPKRAKAGTPPEGQPEAKYPRVRRRRRPPD